jgi:hypothetical protein
VWARMDAGMDGKGYIVVSVEGESCPKRERERGLCASNLNM